MVEDIMLNKFLLNIIYFIGCYYRIFWDFIELVFWSRRFRNNSLCWFLFLEGI